jgi:hypothetical protein
LLPASFEMLGRGTAINSFVASVHDLVFAVRVVALTLREQPSVADD